MKSCFALFFPEIIFILSFLCLLILTCYIFVRFYLPARLMFRLRDFFLIRDELVLYIANNPEKMDDIVVNHFVNSTNVFIKLGQDLNLEKLIDSVSDSDPEIKRKSVLISEKVKFADPEVREIVRRFYQAAVRFFVFNSSVGSIARILFRVFGLVIAIPFHFSILKIKSIYSPSAKKEIEIISDFRQMGHQVS